MNESLESCKKQENTEKSETKSCGAKADLSVSTTSCRGTIAALAYKKWEEAGCPVSDGIEFWLAAEAELQN